MEEGIKVMDKEIEDFKSLIKFLTIYHGNENIPKFLANKQNAYVNTLSQFSLKEIQNSHLTATLYHSLLNSHTQTEQEEEIDLN